MTNKFFFMYFGNKYGAEANQIYQYIGDNINETKTLVEPFCGACGLSLFFHIKKGVKNMNYELNDIDSNLINFLRKVKEGELPDYIDYCNNMGEQYYNNKKLWSDFARRKNKNLKEYYVYKKLCRGHLLDNYDNTRSHDKYTPISYEKIKIHEEFFKSDNVILSNENYDVIFEKYRDDPSAMLFLDPPNIITSNETDNTKMYVDILKLLKDCKCKVIMLAPKCAIIELLYKDNIKLVYEKMYQMSKKKIQYMIIANFEPSKKISNKLNREKMEFQDKIIMQI